MTKFAKQLLTRRNHLGLTQEQVSDKLGMSRRSYIELEKGRREPDPVEEAGITAILGQIAPQGKETPKAGQPTGGHYTMTIENMTSQPIPHNAGAKVVKKAMASLQRRLKAKAKAVES